MKSSNVPLVGNKVLSLLREAAKKPPSRGQIKQAFNPLNNLSDTQLVEVYFRLEKGQEIDRIRKVIQLDWNIAKELHVTTMRGYLKRFREYVLTPVQKAIAETPPSGKSVLTNNVKHVLEELDGLGTLRWLIQEQVTRLQMYRNRENMAKLPISGTNTVVKDLGELLERYLKLEMELGLLDTKESKINLVIKEKFVNIMDNALKNSGQNLVMATHKFLESAEEESVYLEEGEDGTYRKIEESES